MRIPLLLYFSLLFSLYSCQNATKKSNRMETKKVEFEEMNHVNLPLIFKEYHIFTSQEDIDAVYKKINEANPMPRKNPIPGFDENETYVVIQPKISKNDFEVLEIAEAGSMLQIKIKETDNPEFKGMKHAASIIKLNQKNSFKNAKIVKQ